MKYPAFSIRDLKADSFGFPYFDTNEQTAKRGFAYQINNNDIMGFSPADYDLYQVGAFDMEKGVFDKFDVPEFVCSGNSVYGK